MSQLKQFNVNLNVVNVTYRIRRDADGMFTLRQVPETEVRMAEGTYEETKCVDREYQFNSVRTLA